MSFSNEALIGLIRDRLSQDSRIAALAIDVGCYDGYVCLMGCVDRADQKKIAVDIITGLIGVRKVKDELLVRGTRNVTPSAA